VNVEARGRLFLPNQRRRGAASDPARFNDSLYLGRRNAYGPLVDLDVLDSSLRDPFTDCLFPKAEALSYFLDAQEVGSRHRRPPWI
jgi:hypothetical protein